jgi:septum formation protein
VPFDKVDPGVDETLEPGTTPYLAATVLATKKALAVSTRPGFEESLVIGSDQICVAPDGEILHKPMSEMAAVEQLERLSGKQHRLVTGVAVAHGERVATAFDVHTLTMHPLGRHELARYVAKDEPLDCAGSYRLEAAGMALFSRIDADPEGADECAIIGLPLMKTLRLLREHFGWTIFERGGAA